MQLSAATQAQQADRTHCPIGTKQSRLSAAESSRVQWSNAKPSKAGQAKPSIARDEHSKAKQAKLSLVRRGEVEHSIVMQSRRSEV